MEYPYTTLEELERIKATYRRYLEEAKFTLALSYRNSIVMNRRWENEQAKVFYAIDEEIAKKIRIYNESLFILAAPMRLNRRDKAARNILNLFLGDGDLEKGRNTTIEKFLGEDPDQYSYISSPREIPIVDALTVDTLFPLKE